MARKAASRKSNPEKPEKQAMVESLRRLHAVSLKMEEALLSVVNGQSRLDEQRLVLSQLAEEQGLIVDEFIRSCTDQQILLDYRTAVEQFLDLLAQLDACDDPALLETLQGRLQICVDEWAERLEAVIRHVLTCFGVTLTPAMAPGTPP